MHKKLLEVKDLTKHFKTKNGLLKAVDGISFAVEEGKTLGIVGESGCGKSTAGRAILQLIEPTSGTVLFDGRDITVLNKKEMRELRRDMQIVFQDPFSSLDPRKTVYQLISEPLNLNGLLKNKTLREKRVMDLMETVGLSSRLMNSYPHELDGGRRQRIGIARALVMEPKFILCDEQVSALDVSIQAQILNLLSDLQEKFKLTYVFITHDLSVVNHFSDEIAVMYLGKIIERTSAEGLFKNPAHPYTKALLSAIPVPEVGNDGKRIILKGEIASPINLGEGCRFEKRCWCSTEKCKKTEPSLVEIQPGHFVACHYPLSNAEH